MTKLAYIDCETTGLDPLRHEIWDVGLIVEDYETDGLDLNMQEYQWYLPVTLDTAEPRALTVGKFYQRHPQWQRGFGPSAELDIRVADPTVVAREVAKLTNGAHLVGNVVSFDAAFLTYWMRRIGAVPTWHYHLVDCEALVAGALHLPPPWKSADLSRAVGVEPPGEEDHHTALGDARWSRRLFHAAMNYKANKDAANTEVRSYGQPEA
jgi:oligoribonuclease (3'-5' exoribonuclease)